MSIQENYRRLREEIDQIALGCGRDPRQVTLVAVSKKQPLEAVFAAHQAGCQDFGENRLPEALEKVEGGPIGVRWHFIGSIQSKKLPKLIGSFCLLHGLDSLELAHKISQRCLEAPLAILLQVNVSGEESKHGWSPSQLEADWSQLAALEGVEIKGLMTMAPYTEDEGRIRTCFRGLRELRDRLATPERPLAELSMGMSNDYRIAIEEGATLVRIGTALFQIYTDYD